MKTIYKEDLQNQIKELERKLCCKTRFYDSFEDFPETGSEGVLYIDESTGSIYIWNGVGYTTNEPYYSNSYVERLKLLGSDVQYSNLLSGSSVAPMTLTNNRIFFNSVYIPKTSIITGINIIGQTSANFTDKRVVSSFTPEKDGTYTKSIIETADSKVCIQFYSDILTNTIVELIT